MRKDYNNNIIKYNNENVKQHKLYGRILLKTNKQTYTQIIDNSNNNNGCCCNNDLYTLIYYVKNVQIPIQIYSKKEIN